MARPTRFKQGIDQKLFSGQVQERLRIEYQSVNGIPIGSPANRKMLDSLNLRFTEFVVPATEKILKGDFNKALDDVYLVLLEGIEGVDGGAPGVVDNIDVKWESHKPEYTQKKIRKNFTTAFTYWRRDWKGTKGGSLGNAFGVFRSTYKKRVLREETLVKIRQRGNRLRQGGKIYVAEIDYTLPRAHRGRDLFDRIFRQSFMNFEGELVGPPNLQNPFGTRSALSRIAYNEFGSESKHRPFIRELMKNRGKRSRKRMKEWFRTVLKG